MINIECGECGIQFTVPDHWYTKRREDQRVFYCPNGHQRRFAESEADRLRRELTREKQRTEQLEARARNLTEQRDRKERQVRATRGVVTRIKNRLAAALCPVCDHAFPEIAAHLAAEHPDWAPDAEPLETDIEIPAAWSDEELKRFYVEGALARRKGPAVNPYANRGRAAARRNAWQAGWNDNAPRVPAEASPGNAT